MIAIDRRSPDTAGAEIEETSSNTAAAALWTALSAERRARDERTARLRAMRLIAGEDEGETA